VCAVARGVMCLYQWSTSNTTPAAQMRSILECM